MTNGYNFLRILCTFLLREYVRSHKIIAVMKIKSFFTKKHDAGLIREFEDNYYDRIRVYKSQFVADTPSAAVFAVELRSILGLHIDRIFFEDLQLRDEENALPIEEAGDIDDDLMLSYLAAADIDIIKFVGEYDKKPIEIGIRKTEWEVWLRIWQLTDNELKMLEARLGLC